MTIEENMKNLENMLKQSVEDGDSSPTGIVGRGFLANYS